MQITKTRGDDTQRWQYSASLELPLVELARLDGEGEGLVDVALPFEVALEQPWDSSAAYVLLGVGSQRERTFCVTLESPEWLADAISDVTRVGRAQS